MKRVIIGLALILGACGERSPMGPSPIVPASSPPVVAVPPPPIMSGYFVSGRGAPVAIQPGSVSIICPSWGENAQAIANALVAKGAWVIVVVGDQRPGGGAGWKQTRAWLQPIERTGRLAGIYVADEPLANGWTRAQVEAAIAEVKADGYRTMIAEEANTYKANGRWRPPVTWFGVTAYYDPLLWTLQLYQEDRNLDVVFGDVGAKGKWEDFAGWVGKGLFIWSWDMGGK